MTKELFTERLEDLEIEEPEGLQKVEWSNEIRKTKRKKKDIDTDGETIKKNINAFKIDTDQGLLYSGLANAQLEWKTGIETVLPYI